MNISSPLWCQLGIFQMMQEFTKKKQLFVLYTPTAVKLWSPSMPDTSWRTVIMVHVMRSYICHSIKNAFCMYTNSWKSNRRQFTKGKWNGFLFILVITCKLCITIPKTSASKVISVWGSKWSFMSEEWL